VKSTDQGVFSGNKALIWVTDGLKEYLKRLPFVFCLLLFLYSNKEERNQTGYNTLQWQSITIDYVLLTKKRLACDWILSWTSTGPASQSLAIFLENCSSFASLSSAMIAGLFLQHSPGKLSQDKIFIVKIHSIPTKSRHCTFSEANEHPHSSDPPCQSNPPFWTRRAYSRPYFEKWCVCLYKIICLSFCYHVKQPIYKK